MNNIQIHEILNTIAKQAFGTDKIPPFYVCLKKVENEEYNGIYSPETSTISIYNLSRPSQYILATSLHEMAHHCEYTGYGTTDHKVRFYRILKRLMVSAIELGYLSLQEVELLSDVEDMKQIRRNCSRIKAVYNPNIDLDRHYRYIEVTGDTYRYKEKLKELDYIWDSYSENWYYKIHVNDLEEEIHNLHFHFPQLKVKVRMVTDFSVTTFYYVKVTGSGTYYIKDSLKAEKFIYNASEKAWTLKFDAKDFERIALLLRSKSGIKCEFLTKSE